LAHLEFVVPELADEGGDSFVASDIRIAQVRVDCRPNADPQPRS
jgi:hypothetical protein